MRQQKETWPEIKRRHAAEKWALVYGVWAKCRCKAETAQRLNMQRAAVQRLFRVWHDNG